MSISPPSKLTITATLVSFVFRDILAVRAEPVEGDILQGANWFLVACKFVALKLIESGLSSDKIR